MVTSMNTLAQRVEQALVEIRPALGLHGGSIELVGITPEKIVQLRFQGACVGCIAADSTLEHGLKEMLMIQIEEIEDVVSVNSEPKTHLPPAYA